MWYYVTNETYDRRKPMAPTLIAQPTKVPREVLVARLRERDGDLCQYADCGLPLDFDTDFQALRQGDPKRRQEPTIDHWMPQYWCKAEGWTPEEIWDLSNLRLMHKKCNAAKGDRIPNEDGTLPARKVKTFRYRRDKRAQRAEICTACNAGRNLGPDEWCNACGSGPNPGRYPKWRQMSVKECDHDLFYCVSCTIWFPEIRRSVIDSILTGGEGYE
jgi:5-methylcytosine-specific restriction endonuclease McrA